MYRTILSNTLICVARVVNNQARKQGGEKRQRKSYKYIQDN